MRTQRSKVFGFLSDDIATTPFAGQIIQGAQEAAWEREMLLLTFSTAGDPAMEEAAVEMAIERGVEGIIFATMYHRMVQVPKMPSVSRSYWSIVLPGIFRSAAWCRMRSAAGIWLPNCSSKRGIVASR